MRPSQLTPLFADITTIPGIGRKMKPLFAKVCGERVLDLLWMVPAGVVDRRYMPGIMEMRDGEMVTSIVRVQQHLAPKKFAKHGSSAQPFKVRCYNETGFLTLVFFHAKPEWIEASLPVGEKRVVSGRVEKFHGEIQIAHPDWIGREEELEKIRTLQPIYPLTQGLSAKLVIKSVRHAVASLTEIFNWPEWLSAETLARHSFPDWRTSISTLHQPETEADISLTSPTRMRLAYDELLALQLALRMARAENLERSVPATPLMGTLRAAFCSALPFSLTQGQRDVIAQITADQTSPARMMRLLQGDVGSGKTVVALAAMLNSVEAGFQAALMAPTEILARQHFQNFKTILDALGVSSALLTGSTKPKERDVILAGLLDGSIALVFGTHALFQDRVGFHRLRLIVIDEQHRFGVNQRLQLTAKGVDTDLLVMSATPIPRTLALTLYGDMECSTLTEKPAFKQPITTRVMPSDKLDLVAGGLARILEKKQKAYWICPLIEASEALDLAAVNDRHQMLLSLYPGRVGLLHGQMKADARDRVMQDFRDGSIDILVATTVVEVGVDVPSATAIIIEHAERFGLSQLHQLRGRVGRGAEASSCVLLYDSTSERIAKRLQVMRDTEDGFCIAEEDLRLRGSGELLGTKQSGVPEFRFADLAAHFTLLREAREEAAYLLALDPELTTPRSQPLRALLHLFDYDALLSRFRAG